MFISFLSSELLAFSSLLLAFHPSLLLTLRSQLFAFRSYLPSPVSKLLALSPCPVALSP